MLEDDGGKVAVDSSHADYSIRYCSSQFLGKFERRIVAPDNTVQRTETPTLLVDGSGGQSLFTYDKTLQFYTPLRLNSLEPARLLIGTSQLYESFDRGDHLQVVGSLGAPVGGSTYGSPLVYGGVRGGQSFPDLIYVGAGDAIYLRTTRGQPLHRLTGYPGGDVAALVTDPRDWTRVVALDTAAGRGDGPRVRGRRRCPDRRDPGEGRVDAQGPAPRHQRLAVRTNVGASVLAHRTSAPPARRPGRAACRPGGATRGAS